MKYVDEYRDPKTVQTLSREIHQITHHPWTIMEICGGQTHAIVRYGLDRLLPSEISLIHGPGCPVCVTPIELIDTACELAKLPDVILCSFGDMLRVPGTHSDLLRAKAQGGDVRVIYSPLDAIAIARANPSRQIVLFAVGFETTAPAQAIAILQAHRLELKNFFVLVAHVLVPPAIEALLSAPDNHVQGFLAPGHVCTVMGYDMYQPISQKYNVPFVVTGFEPVDILTGIKMVVHQLEEGRSIVENQYERSVQRSGNLEAQKIIGEVFQASSRHWRGIGTIPNSGLQLRPRFAKFDALQRFHDRLVQSRISTSPSNECQSGRILQGLMKPSDCSAFGTRCTPDHPLGAPMVSNEGACAAYFQYRASNPSTLSS